jgi:hypothetical protein
VAVKIFDGLGNWVGVFAVVGVCVIVGVKKWVSVVVGDECGGMVKVAVLAGRVFVIVGTVSGAVGEQEDTAHAIQAIMM